MNKRAPDMWRQIREYVDFTGKTVVDLGCGPGDFMSRALQDGASWVIGVDIDPDTARQAKETCLEIGKTTIVLVDDIVNMPHDSEYDIGMCFSVLPYTSNPVAVLDWMSKCVGTSLIEMQYANDGPGPAQITDDLDMLKFLEMFWDKPQVIGRTEISVGKGRRTIWLCNRSES